VEYAGAVYHVRIRGDGREDIFRDDPDREVFLAALAETGGKTGWEVPALCLMNNHFHLVVETPQGNLVAGTYPGRFNRHRERDRRTVGMGSPGRAGQLVLPPGKRKERNMQISRTDPFI
jgi:hypothetical protein